MMKRIGNAWTIAVGYGVLLAVLTAASGCGREAAPADNGGRHGNHDGHAHARQATAAVAAGSAASGEGGLPTGPDTACRQEAGDGCATPGGSRCAAHNEPGDLCFICDPTLRDAGRLWCAEHGRYEDRCWLCHPDAQDTSRPYCEAHFLYEDECFLCNPALRDRAKPAAPAGAAALMCGEHGVREDECGICHPSLLAGLAPGQGLKVRLPTVDSAKLAGIRVEPPRTGSIAEGMACHGEIIFNQNMCVPIVAPAGGIVRSVDADLGDRVAENQALASIWSAAIAETIARAVHSHQALDRERRLSASRIAAGQDLQDAEAAHRAACQQARTYGFSEEDIDALGRKPDEPVYLPVRAPFAGELVERTAVKGALVDAGARLFLLADRSTMWAMLNIPQAALAGVRPGQPVDVRVDALPGQVFTGRLTWIAASVDERTRLARVRADIPNPDGVLKDRMFAQGRIVIRSAAEAVLLPAAAIQTVDGHSLAFVQLADDLYEARVLLPGAQQDGLVEVRAGLTAREPVVVAGAFALKSQLLIERLGAGCAHE